MSKLDKVTYVHTLVIGSIHEYKLNGPHGSDCPIGARGGHLCFPGLEAHDLVLSMVRV